MLNSEKNWVIIPQMALFIGLVLGAGWVIGEAFSPPWSWGSQTIDRKRHYLLEDSTGINALFIGDSRTGQGVIPDQFDKQVSLEAGPPVRSFNFGIGSLMPPESYYVIENLIGTDSLPLKYLFIELSGLPRVGPRMLHTLRARYWYSPQSYLFTVQALLTSREGPRAILGKLRSHTVSFLERIFNLGFFKNLYLYNTSKAPVNPGLYKQRGFYSLENVKDSGIYAIRSAFLKDSSLLSKNRMVSMATTYSERNPFPYSKAHLARIQALIRFCEARGVHPYFVLFPQPGPRSNFVVPLFFQIPEPYRIEICDARKFPFLYAADQYFDGKHFNQRGAMHFTRELARQFVQKHTAPSNGLGK